MTAAPATDTTAAPRILILGYGNPGRLDDGLGPRLATIIEEKNLPGVRVETLYQLNVEQAADAAASDLVFFVDAACEGPEPFFIKPVEAGEPAGFTSHHMSPSGVMALCESCFGVKPKAFVLGIRGYDFNRFGEELTGAAESNLGEAAAFLERAILDGGRSLPDQAAYLSEER